MEGFITAHQALIVLSWVLIAALIGTLLLIARFYQRLTGQHTYYWALGLPMALFAVAAARSAVIDQLGGDPLADALWFAGGVVLTGFSLHIYYKMMSKRK